MSPIRPTQIKEISLQIVFVGLGLALCTWAHAQNRGSTYRGPRADIQVYQKSPDGDFSFCDRDPQAKLTRATYEACVKAIAGARNMAEVCAQANGEIDGYRRGYSWAFNATLNESQKDPYQYNSGKQSVLTDANTSPFIRQKAEETNRNTYGEASSRGASLAIQRFTDFVDSGASRAGGVPSNLLPSPIPVPAHGSPYQNPYTILLPGQFQSIDELINRAQFDANQIAFINRYDEVYGVTRPQWNVRGLYTSDGIYQPNPSMCGNPDQIFNRWISNDRLGRGIYSGYKRGDGPTRSDVSRGVDAQATAPAPAPSDTRAADTRGGQPGNGPVRGQPSSAPTAPLPQAPVPPAPEPDLQDIYARSFRQAYAGYSNYYYSVGFYRNLDLGQFYGETVGRQLGTQYAFQVGRRDAFNEQFFQTESNLYLQYAVSGFDSGFKNKYQEFISSPQPAFELVDVVGEVDDGIIQPNEKVAVTIRVKNYGGVGTQFAAQLAGNVSEVKGFNLQAPALSSQVITSPIAARVASSSGSNARVVLQVAGREIPISQYVTDQVTPTHIAYDASIPNGLVKVTVMVQNHSKKKSYDVVKVNLSDAFNHILSQNVGFLEAGETRPVTFTISDYDPLLLIDGKVSLQAQSFLGSLNVGTQSVTVQSMNRNLDLALTFDTLAQNPALAFRETSLQARLLSEVEAEATDANRSKYDNDPETLIAQLVNVHEMHKQTAAAQTKYAALADLLQPVIKKMKGPAIRIFAKQSGNQKYLSRQLDALRGK